MSGMGMPMGGMHGMGMAPGMMGFGYPGQAMPKMGAEEIIPNSLNNIIITIILLYALLI